MMPARCPSPALRASLALASLLTGAVAFAQGWGGGGRFGGVREEVKLLERYDRDKNGLLQAEERRVALREFGFDPAARPVSSVTKGRALTGTQVKSYETLGLYDPAALRTLFLKFDTPTWEDELAVFKGSDVKVPASITIDGKVYRDVGVSFRGQTSFMSVSSGYKRSMNLDFNMIHKEQRLLGATNLTLLNAAGDSSFLRSMLYMHIARAYLPAPKANYARVVINGEDWGIYVSQQPVNKQFVQAAGGATGPYWRVPGTPRGRGGLNYLGEDPAAYERIYELKSRGDFKTDAEAWAALVRLCRVLNEAPASKLQAALAPLLDVDEVLRFLAVDNALLNSDAYYARASDYSLYRDAHGRFHLAPHDANESLRPIEGFGWGRRRDADASRAGSVLLDPMSGADDPSKALLNRLLAVPELRARYLGYVREIAERWLDWKKLGPIARQYHTSIAEDVRLDTHKLHSTAGFAAALERDVQDEYLGGPLNSPGMSLKSFAEQRRTFLLKNIPAN